MFCARPKPDRANIVTVTVLGRCRWCGRSVEQRAGPGRPRVYCRRSCRQRDFEARQRATRHGLDESDVIIARAELEDLRDKLYVLRCAVDDVRRDLASSPTKQDYVDAVAWLIDAAHPLVAEPTQRP